MISGLGDWSRHVLAQLPAALPGSCALCGRAGNVDLCAGCDAQFFRGQQRRCAQCALPLPGAAASSSPVCGACLQQPPAFDATIVAVDYAAPVDQLVLALKFGHRLALAPLMANLLHAALHKQPRPALPDQLAPVPLGPRRLAERGFNQALEIARPLARALRVALDPQLAIRTRDTNAQAMLHPDQRRENMRHAFTVGAHAIDRIRGQHIGIVDDVITTGETLDELAATLKRFGAARVTNFVFARTVQK